MFFIDFTLTPDEADGYAIDIKTNLPDDDLVKRVLKDTLESWGDRRVNGFNEDGEE